MDLSLGFLVTIFLVLFPGLIYRKLYFYGEFSKEFNSGLSLISLLAISVIPGLIILILSYIYFCIFFDEINLSEVIDIFKDIKAPEVRLAEKPLVSFNILLQNKIAPFIAFQYLISIVLGVISGRIIRITKLDTKIKSLRFKNYWFYIFNGQYDGFRKLKHLKAKNQKHLFTKADILIDSNSQPLLYSGIVVDYELDFNDYCSLSKIYLQNAERYSIKNEKKIAIRIPGTLLIVDCSTMININLTYIYEDAKDILKSKLPGLVEICFGLISILIFPLFIYHTDLIKFDFYDNYFKFFWLKKIFVYFIIVQSIGILNPFLKIKDDYKYISTKVFIIKLIFIILLWTILCFV